MVNRLSLDQPNDSFAQSKEYICIIFDFMGLIRLINLSVAMKLIQSIKMKACHSFSSLLFIVMFLEFILKNWTWTEQNMF